MPLVSVLKIPRKEIPKFRRGLLAWFKERKRDLPWRRTRDPYRIWISEIMLQQTRVAAVIPYYENFLAKFPTLRSLARAKTEAVLGRWAGLGYYSRARNLHHAARQIVARHRGHFPRDHQATLALPGIGRYTAAAVLSIAYDEPLAVLDGNVARVLARVGAVSGDLRAPAVWRELETRAQYLLARQAPSEWNQAMMEVGATVCTPKSPRCEQCPVAPWCRARELGIAEQLPTPRKKRATQQVTLIAAVLLDRQGRTLLVRQTSDDGALFSRMWQFPALELTEDAASGLVNDLASDPASRLVSDLAQYLRQNFQITANGNMKQLETVRHTVTFRNLRIVPFVVHVARLPRIERTRTAVLGNFGNLPISNATRKIANAALGTTRA
jgi:A/G-specific adenine glycosylase